MHDVEATARSGGIVSLFYRLNHRSESIFSAQEFKPVAFSSGRRRTPGSPDLVINFSPDGLINAKITKGKLNTAGKSEEVSFKSKNATAIRLGGLFAKSLPVNPAEDPSFEVFNGEDRYLISFHVVGREGIRMRARSTTHSRSSRWSRSSPTPKGKRIRKAHLWVSADGSREVLKLESEVRVGSVSATLIRFVPDAAPEPDSARARPGPQALPRTNRAW